MKMSPKIAVILTLLATLFWGSNFQATKVAIAAMSPWTASAERFLIAVVVIFIYMSFRNLMTSHALRKNLLAFISLGAIGVAGFNGALFVGLQTSNPITAALIMATTPISANILEAIINRRMPQFIRVLGMLISLFGVSMVISNGKILMGGALTFSYGDVIIFIGSLGWAVYTVGTRAMVTESTPLETTAWTMFFGAIILSAMAFVYEQPISAVSSASVASHLAGLYMGIAGSVLAYLFWVIGISTRGPGKTSIFFNFVPLFAILVQITFGTVPGNVQLIGAVITIFGVLLGQGQLSFFSRKQVEA
ncbi:DMT family transporter [Atlantibacter subterranea]|uniref:DMT family transporter n=1 Tax=Atlantibacter subterraneus TaxID=255519 RepID=UPI0020C2DBBC|nr:DMT family transporter [Atlantibacter subterranea]UTJ46774.1 DMT family transporter [Atlantibacter subterranea]